MLPRSLVTYEADVPPTATSAAAARPTRDMQLSLTGRVRSEPGGPPRSSPPDTTSPGTPPGGTGLPRRSRAGTGLAGPTPVADLAGTPGGPRPDAALPRRPGPAVTVGTHNGLPRRVRQASLSPHLRNGTQADPSAATADREPAARTPEQARDLLASLQRGWERGRQDDEVPGAPAAEGPAGAS
jgi:hypothetical protein